MDEQNHEQLNEQNHEQIDEQRDEQNNFLIHLFSFPLPQFQFLSAAHRKDVLNL